MNTGVEAETMLAIDVGSVHTRASLFDVVDGRFRLVATGRSATTAGAPLLDISEGVRQAIDQVQAVTGRPLVDESENLILPASSSGAGVDMFVATASAGPKVRAVLVGMMPGVSMQSLRRLADTSYVEVVGEIQLTDRRREEERIDVVRSARPDLVLIAGGTDRGAGQSVLRIAEAILAAPSRRMCRTARNRSFRATRRRRGPGSTGEVDFWISRDVREVVRSHVNYVVADTRRWEQSAAYVIDTHPGVAAFVKNAGLGFAIPYLHNGQPHEFVPDFLIRLAGTDERYVILETKGFDEREEVKRAAAIRWVQAVNADRKFGRWDFVMAKSISEVGRLLDDLSSAAVEAPVGGC